MAFAKKRKKVDSTNPNKGLRGAGFHVQSENGSFSQDVITGSDGTYTLKDLKCRGVLAMADKRRLNLSFSLSSPLQREAWERLFAIPAGQRTEAVCHAVCRMYERDALAETVRAVIREELRGGELILEKEEAEQRREAGDVDESILGFLLSLQREGDDTD